MSESEHEAIESLEHLGLSNYEARVFVALQKLGTGTARDIHQVADVPRSQVYGAAEELENRGLVEIQQSTPKRYRPVSLDAARSRLAERLEQQQARAFEYLETIQREQRDEETRDDVWTIRGRDSVNDRTANLAARATDWIVFATAELEPISDRLVDVLRERAAAGVHVLVVSENPAVRALFDDTPLDVEEPTGRQPTDFMGRVLLVDDNVFLLSVLADADLPEVTEETAIWSAETAMAAVLVQIVYGGMMAVVRGDAFYE